MNKTQRGKEGEDIAAVYLQNQRYKILERNFRIRGGEIDIIALDEQTLVYIEVKTRTNRQFGLPEESVTPAKIHFLQRAAKFYRVNRKYQNLPGLERIDVVTVDLANPALPRVNLIKNAGF